MNKFHQESETQIETVEVKSQDKICDFGEEFVQCV